MDCPICGTSKEGSLCPRCSEHEWPIYDNTYPEEEEEEPLHLQITTSEDG